MLKNSVSCYVCGECNGCVFDIDVGLVVSVLLLWFVSG